MRVLEVRRLGLAVICTVGAALLLPVGAPAAGGVVWSPTSVDFGTVALGHTVTRSLNATNNTGASYSVTSVTTRSGTGDITFQNGCVQVPANGTCHIDIAWRPIGTGPGGVDNRAETVIVQDSMGQTQFPMTGIATQTDIVFEPAAPDFGMVVVGTTHRIDMIATNHSPGAMTLGFGAAPNEIGVPFPGTACQDIPVGGSCTFSISWTPIAAGDLNGWLYAITSLDIGYRVPLAGNAEWGPASSGRTTPPRSATLVLDPASITMGSELTIRGAFFPSNQTFALSIGSVLASEALPPVHSDADGAFVATATVPDLGQGAYQVCAALAAGSVCATLYVYPSSLTSPSAPPSSASALGPATPVGYSTRYKLPPVIAFVASVLVASAALAIGWIARRRRSLPR